MKFLALSPVAAYALLAGVALVIALLHLLKPPPPRFVIASVLLWTRVKRDRKRPAPRRLLALLLALGVGLSMALALTRPEVPAIGASAQRLVLILDNSPSMAARTRDGRSRWQHALERAHALLERSSAISEVMLMDTAGQLRVSGFVDRNSALAALHRVPLAAWGSARWSPESPATAAQVHLFTDGVAQIETPKGAIVHSVFEAADNVAVTAFEARPLTQDPTRYEALVQVLNASPGDQRVRLLISGGDGFSIAQDLEVRAGETVNATFDISDFEGGVLGAAAASESDAFPLDDLAYAVVPRHRPKRVLLVTSGNAPLEDALRNLPGVRLTVVTPQNYARAVAHDALVFDRFAPAEPPAAGALLLRPPARKWLAGPRMNDGYEAYAVTGGIAWRNVRLGRASVAAKADSKALVTAGEARARWIKVGFALQDSNFALQPDFPVFVGNALTWVTEPIAVLTRGLGSIEVALREAKVRDGSGNPVANSTTTRGIVFEAPRADVYTVSAPSGQILVVANVADTGYSLINRTRIDASAVDGYRPARFWNAELWMLLLALAVVLLLVEWTAYTRRATA